MSSGSPPNHWKLGLFVVLALSLAAVTAVYLGAASLRRDGVSYFAYFDEPVGGLDLGSPILFRGVRVGQVGDIDLASDRRHVRVTLALFSDELAGLGLADGAGGMRVPADLRVQLIGQGITGLKALQLDFFGAAADPVPVLTFAVPARTIPTARSTLRSIEDTVTGAVERIPEVADALVRVAANADRVLASIERAQVGDQLTATLAQANATLASIDRTLREANVGPLARKAEASLGRLDAVMIAGADTLASLHGPEGVLASVRRASDGVGDAAASTPALADDVSATLHELREAAAAFRRLGEALERDPDMLLKGRGE